MMALLEVRQLRKSFRVGWDGWRPRVVTAVDGVNFDLDGGSTLGLVGESGSGKSTTALTMLRFTEPDDGSVHFDGTDLTQLRRSELRGLRKDLQLVFQNPYASLNPGMTVADIVGEPLTIHERLRGPEKEARVSEALHLVGLGGRHFLRRYPHEFSGGQRQRIAIARAIVLRPKLIVADEAVSALDASTQSGVINLLQDIVEDLGIALLFISHDLAVVRHISHRIAVMYLGQIVESGPVDEVYSRPQHPYTEALLSAIPYVDPVRQKTRERLVLRGDIPDPAHPPQGCRFHQRCPYALEICNEADPELRSWTKDHYVACHLHEAGPSLKGGTVRGVEPTRLAPSTT